MMAGGQLRFLKLSIIHKQMVKEFYKLKFKRKNLINHKCTPKTSCKRNGSILITAKFSNMA